MSGRLVVAGLSALALATGCSSAATSPRASARVTSTASPVAAAGPCASVKTTTPITDVPQACAELWAPYQVTEVPPPDILQQEHVPAAPKVVNRTNGAVSDAEAQRWADASNRDSGWFKWAEESDQPTLLLRLVGPRLVGSAEQKALADGGRVIQPDCNLYPLRNSLFPLDATGRLYLSRKGFNVTDEYVFVVVYGGPCIETVISSSGAEQPVSDFTVPTTVFVVGHLVHDSVLGDLWFSDAGGGCDDSAGPPTNWCSR